MVFGVKQMKQKLSNGEVRVIQTLNSMSAPQPPRELLKENGMKNCNAPENQTKRRILAIACATGLAVALTLSVAHIANAHQITPPRAPGDIEVPPGNKAFLVGHGVGTQNYICLPSSAGFAFTLFTPEATLFNPRDGQQVITHYFSPNNNPFDPSDKGVIRVTWEDSRDASIVWGAVEKSSSDANFVAPGAIPWLKVKAVGAQDGPTGGDRLSGTTFIQRVNTVGGSAPATGCAASADVGKKAFVPYTADYFFYFDPYADDRR
jgi:hypothetical protein